MKIKQLLLCSAFAALSALKSFAADAPAAFTVEVSGHGRPMILIPGLSCSGEVWNDTVDHYKDRFECHVLTLAGFAGVPAKDGPVVEPAREAIASYVRSHHLEKPVVVGHSLGGSIAMDLASTHPDLVGTLVIVDSYPFLAGVQRPGCTPEQAKTYAEGMRNMLNQIPDEAYRSTLKAGTYTRNMVISEAHHDRIASWGLASDRRTSTDAMAELMGSDLREKLASVKAPTLVLAAWIAYRPYVTHESIEAQLRAQYAKLPKLKYAISDTANHFIMFDDAAWFYSQLDSVL